MGCEMKVIKKITALFLIMILTISTSGFVNKVESAQVSKSQTNDSPISMGVSAHAYVVMDANSGEIIMSQDADKKIYPASTTKLLTAVVAIENCNLDREIDFNHYYKLNFGVEYDGILEKDETIRSKTSSFKQS